MGSTIIGLCGFKGSGKDTVGNCLKQFGFEKDSFAKPLKDICSTIFGWDRSLLEGDTSTSREWRERTDPWWSERLGILDFSPRLAMQLVGTNSLRRGLSQDIWVASLENRVIQASTPTVIVDCRFPNEMDVVRNQGGQVLWVKSDIPQWYDLAKTVADTIYEEHLGSKDPGTYLVQHVRELATLEQLGVHESEWMWLGYPVDYVIQNDGSLSQLYNLVETWYNDTD